MNVPNCWNLQQLDLKIWRELSNRSNNGAKSRDKIDESQHLILSFFKSDFTSKDVLMRIEEVQIRSLRRIIGLMIIGGVINTKTSQTAVVSCLNWLWSALRKGANFIVHYTEDLDGCSRYIKEKLQNEFFWIIRGIIYQMKSWNEVEHARFLLNWLRWKYTSSEHSQLWNSGIIEVLTHGAEIDKQHKNMFKFSWGHKIIYRNYLSNNELSHAVIETFEWLYTNVLSRITSESHVKFEEKELERIERMKRVHSSVGDESEALMSKLWNAIIWELNRYSKLVKSFDPIDWKAFVKHRNKMRSNGQIINEEDPIELDDEKTLEELKEEQEKQEFERLRNWENREEQSISGSQPRNRIDEILEDRADIEWRKIRKLYDDKIIMKLLRMFELFTSISLVNSKVREYANRIISSENIALLLEMLLSWQFKHNLIICRILHNLSMLERGPETLDNACINLCNSQSKELFDLNPVSQFKESPFLKFAFNFLLLIRSSQWRSQEFTNSGEYEVSCWLVRFFNSIMKDKHSHKWRDITYSVLDDFLSDTDQQSYSIEEFDVMISLIEGGEFLGLNVGSWGITSDNRMFTIIGFWKEWFDLKPLNQAGYNGNFNIHKICYEYKNKDDSILALSYDKQYPEKRSLFLVKPDDVQLISDFDDKTSTYLLNQTRLQNFISKMRINELPDKTDSTSLTKRWVGMKILVNLINKNGDEINSLIEPQFKNNLISMMLREWSTPEEGAESFRCEWYDQKIYLIKKLATERQLSLRKEVYKSITFKGNMMSISKPLEISTKELYWQVFYLTSAMNYGRIEQGIKYQVLNQEHFKSISWRFDSVVILDSSQWDSIDKLGKIFKNVDTLITSDIDLNQIHDQLKTTNKNIAFFKSIVLVDRKDICSLIELLENDPKVKVASTDEMNLNETFISEITVFGGFNEKEVKKVLRGNESTNLSQKVALITKWMKDSKRKEENKEEMKEEDQKQTEDTKKIDSDSEEDDPEENDPLTIYGLESHEKLESKVNELAAFDNNNFNMAVDVQHASKDDLYTKVYSIKINDIHLEYTKTLATYYKQLWRSTISTFFNELAIEDILDIIWIEKEVTKKFINYILMKGNEAAIIKIKSKDSKPIDDFMIMFNKLITVWSHKSKFINIIDIIYSKAIIKNTKNLLIDSIKAGKDNIEGIYSNEIVSAKTMNVLLIPQTLSQILKIAPDIISTNVKNFPNLISILLLIAIWFRKEFELQRSVYMLIYKILVPIAKSPKSYNPQLIEGLLRLKIFKKMIEKCNFDVTVLSGNKLTPEQKLLFEINLLIHKIDSNMVDKWSLYTYTDILLELGKWKEVLKEGKEFDMISYLIYFNNELSGPQQHTKVYADTYYNMFETKISAKVHFDGFKKMTLRVDETSKIRDDTFIGISSDPDGENILK